MQPKDLSSQNVGNLFPHTQEDSSQMKEMATYNLYAQRIIDDCWNVNKQVRTNRLTLKKNVMKNVEKVECL